MPNESKCPVTGKRQYATEGEALATASHQIATGNAPKNLRPYLCTWCQAWHLTKSDPAKQGSAHADQVARICGLDWLPRFTPRGRAETA